MSVSQEGWFEPSGRFVLRELLGSGGMGVVYRARDTEWGCDVALKTLRDLRPEERQRLKSEYRVLRGIVHPNLVRLNELFADDERCFFTMELVEDARTLSAYAAEVEPGGRSTEQSKALRLQRVCAVGLQLVGALRAVHAAGKRHGDVKPTNALVARDGRVVLLDFGLASPISRPPYFDTARGTIAGTFAYASPEQLWGREVKEASDLYGVGAVLFECLTGRLAFDASPAALFSAKERPFDATLPGLLDGYPREVVEVIAALLDPEPAARPSGEEVEGILRRVLGEAAKDDSGNLSTSSAYSVRGDGPFVGRARELELLRRERELARTGESTVVHVVGPSGVGKTELVKRFLAELATDEPAAPLVLAARCHPLESVPYKAFDAAIDDLARFWTTIPAEVAEALVPPRGVAALLRLFPSLRRVPCLAERPTAEPLPVDPHALRRDGFDALQAVLRRAAARQMLVLWIDDLQWGDLDSAALFEALLGGGPLGEVLVLLSYRAEDLSRSPVLTAFSSASAGASVRTTTLEIAPMAPEEALELAELVAGNGGRRADLLREIVEEAAGSPYFICELARLDPSTMIRAAGSRSGDFFTARVAALRADDRALVELAAVAGSPLPADLLLRAAERSSTERAAITDLCELHLLRWSAGSERQKVQIHHDRLRESLLDVLSPDARVYRHARLLKALEDVAWQDAELLLEQARGARDAGRTRRYAIAAAERAEASLAFERAARLYGEAAEHEGPELTTSELHARRAEALANAGKSAESAPAFERAVATLSTGAAEIVGSTPDPRRLYLTRRAGEQYLKSGRYDDGVRITQGVLAQIGARFPATALGAMAIAGLRRARLFLGRFRFVARPRGEIPSSTLDRLDALWAATTTLSMMHPVAADGLGVLHFLDALRAGERSHAARSFGYEAAFESLIGGRWMHRHATKLLARNHELVARAPDPYDGAFYHLSAAATKFFLCEWEPALEHADEAVRRFRTECRGADYEAAVSLTWAFQAMAMSGRVRDIVRRIPEAIREADERGDLFGANNYRGGFYALGRLAAGELDAVRSDLERVVVTWQEGFFHMHAYHRIFAAVSAELYGEEPWAALARIEEEWPRLVAAQFLFMELPGVELRWARGRALLAAAATLEADDARGSAGEHGVVLFRRDLDRTARAGESTTAALQRIWTRAELLATVRSLVRRLRRASTTTSGLPHAALLGAGLATIAGDHAARVEHLRAALRGYTAAKMALHREVTRWLLGRSLTGPEAAAFIAEAESWMHAEGVRDPRRLARTIAPAVDE